jgi:CRISPR-associated endonuclease/helicase Cas3
MAPPPIEFEPFFDELHAKKPFPWQTELANEVRANGWPATIDLPTGSGKTACIDIALFALACRPSAARRIFFVVDRRIVVGEASLRMQRIADKLKNARKGALAAVAERLRELAGGGDAVPLETYELRGGIYRDESWIESPLQPMVVASTVDQVGSRLLFRGYGISDSVRPMHAGLIANDSLIFLDEAHCSRAFAQTLRAVERYRGAAWTDGATGREFQCVEMTATPSAAGGRTFPLGDKDREPEHLGKRIFAAKPARLVVSKNRPKDLEKLAETLCGEVLDLQKKFPEARRFAVIVNRIATARFVFEKLRAHSNRVDLLIGRMRPIDRDELVWKLDPLKSGEKRTPADELRFVVATQCLEVGADLDFDVLVTECASIDALLQRFGRLNRLGDFAEARGCIVIGSGQVEPKQPDPVYGDALAKTWNWLTQIAKDGEVNMGIESAGDALGTVSQALRALPCEAQAAMKMPGKEAPVLLPAHLDAWVQTNPTPHREPLVGLFLHGREDSEPDVQVVWREDLDPERPADWDDVVGLCPPVSAEAMPVQISAFRRWFFDKQDIDITASDQEGAAAQPEERERWERRGDALVWRAQKSRLISSPRDVSPGDTIILHVSVGGADQLGHVPNKTTGLDRADHAQLQSRSRLILRLHPKLVEHWAETEGRTRVLELLKSEDLRLEDLLDEKGEIDGAPDWVKAALHSARRHLRLEPYPSGEGFVLIGKRQPRTQEEDAGNDEPSRTTPVLLDRHLRDVEEAVRKYRTLTGEHAPAHEFAARLHDYGKADIRFQALLRKGDRMAAQLAPKPLAKSGAIPLSRNERTRNRSMSGLPDGFRHELLSLIFAEDACELDDAARALALHLIASHHGFCRPFPQPVIDPDPPDVSFASRSISGKERADRRAHSLVGGTPDRFWQLTRSLGWWGLAYHEALFRLADWAASGAEAEREPDEAMEATAK